MENEKIRFLEPDVVLVIAKWEKADNDDPIVRYNIGAEELEIEFKVFGEVGGKNCLVVQFPVKMGEFEGNRQGETIEVTKYGLRKLGLGTWMLDPLLFKHPLMAYVIITDVIEPAPWEPELSEEEKKANLKKIIDKWELDSGRFVNPKIATEEQARAFAKTITGKDIAEDQCQKDCTQENSSQSRTDTRQGLHRVV